MDGGAGDFLENHATLLLSPNYVIKEATNPPTACLIPAFTNKGHTALRTIFSYQITKMGTLAATPFTEPHTGR